MKRLTHSSSRWLAGTLVALTLLTAPPAQAGVLSKPFVWLAEKFGKKAVKTVAKDVAKETAEKEARWIARKFGPEVAGKLELIARRTGLPKERITHELRYFGNAYRRAGFSEEAIQFGMKHGQAGRFFVSRTELFSALQKSGVLGEGKEEVVHASWRLVAGNGGSWKTLRRELTRAGLNSGRSRDYCESLFVNRVKAGGLKEFFPSGTVLLSGHIAKAESGGLLETELRQGIDFLHPQKGSPLRVIEFGTGKKPVELAELSWHRIRNNLAEYVERAPNKEQLRAAGMPAELLNPAKIRDPHFPIHDFVTREVYAPEIDANLVKKLAHSTTGEIRAVELP